MGRLVDGQWVQSSVITSDEQGAYDRKPRTFLDCIAENHDRYQPEAGRYHLYVSYACPWAHRALIVRELKQLDDLISVDVVHPEMLEFGWTFRTDFSGTTGDSLYSKKHLYEVYQLAQADVSTSVTVPVLWDRKTKSIVNNESSEIIRIFNTAFNGLTGNQVDLYPDELRDEINAINESVYHRVNNGVYKAGFARTQSVYEQAVTDLFGELDRLENHLQDRSYLCGERLTEADVRLLTTLVRFDGVYFGHFKCNVRRINDYSNLQRYLKKLFNLEAVRNTTNFAHIKHHYYYSHEDLNPTRIVPVGPADWL